MSITKKNLGGIIILTFFFFSMFFAFAWQAQAESPFWDMAKNSGIEQIGNVYNASSGPEDIRVAVAGIVKAFLSLLGIIFLVLLVLAGFKWMTSQGNDEKVKEAIDQIKTAVIGLLVIMAAYGITALVLSAVYNKSTGLSP